MVTLHSITFGYGDKLPLVDFSLTLPDKGAVAIFGDSGSGKTTLLRLLAGLIKPMKGEVTGLLDKRVSMVFQEDRLLPWLSARQNVAICAADEAAADDSLALVELSDRKGSYPRELSGGMQRRVAIARALAYGGDVLLLDEPFKGLDDELKMRVAARIRETHRDALIVLSTHDTEDAELLGCSRRVRMGNDHLIG